MILWQPSDESCLLFAHLHSFCRSLLWCLQTRSHPHLYVCMSLYFPFFPPFAAVGVVSQAVSVRNERGGTNRLANYENWTTINAYVRFKWYDCLRLGLSLSLSLCLCLSLLPPLIFSDWIGTCHHILASLQAFFYVPLRAKLLNREADEVECRSRLHTTGPNLRREKSSFSLLFFTLFFPLSSFSLDR